MRKLRHFCAIGVIGLDEPRLRDGKADYDVFRRRRTCRCDEQPADARQRAPREYRLHVSASRFKAFASLPRGTQLISVATREAAPGISCHSIGWLSRKALPSGSSRTARY